MPNDKDFWNGNNVIGIKTHWYRNKESKELFLDFPDSKNPTVTMLYSPLNLYRAIFSADSEADRNIAIEKYNEMIASLNRCGYSHPFSKY